MNSERWQQIKQVLDGALAVDSGDQPAYLENACRGDAELRSEVESLLLHHQKAEPSFLSRPSPILQTPLSHISPSTRIGRRIGVYQLIAEIGHGGMGEVYRAARVDGQYEKEVAVKLVRGGFDTTSVLDRFRHERQILASLDHPNIARLLDGGTTDEGLPYLVMELIEGTPIDQHCDARGLSITERLELFRPVCSAVQYAHQHLVIHRDIKPSNILVTSQGIPKLLDFGIAKILDPSGSEKTTLVHALTPEYASPEQVRGEPITTATDVYSLGVVLYQLLTGRSPYPVDSANAAEMTRAICEFEPGRPSTAVKRQQDQLTPETVSKCREGSPLKLQKRLSGDLDNILLKALRKEPPRRYGSAEQFGEDIRRHLQGLPVIAAPDSVPYRIQKFVTRHKAGVLASILVALALTGGLAATLREAQIARANAKRAEKHFQEVRNLANSLMFEVHDSIANVPGTMATRKLVVQRSLEYLDNLSRDSAGDVALERELATAYEKVGQLQGNGFRANLGDPQRSLGSLRKALAIRQVITQSSGGRPDDQIALARSYRLTGQVEWLSFGETKASLDKLRTAVQISESNQSLVPELSTYELAQDYKYLGDIQEGFGVRGSLGDLQGALDSHRKALVLLQRISESSSDPHSKQEVAMAEIALGDDFVKGGQRQEAMTHYTRARDILERVDHIPGDTLFHFSLATCHTRIGDVLLIEGRPKDALQHYQEEFELLQTVAAAEPEDAEAQSYGITAKGDIGHALVESGRVKEGQVYLLRSLLEQTALTNRANDAHNRSLLASTEVLVGESFERSGNTHTAVQHYSQALDIYSAIAAADPSDLEDSVHVVETRNHLGRALLRLGRTNESAEHYQAALAIASELDSSNPGNMQVLYGLADTYAGLGNAATARSRGSIEKAAQAEGKDATVWYRMSLDTWRKIPHPTRMSPDELAVGNPYDHVLNLASHGAPSSAKH